jgi:hypothetical protein
MKPILLLLKSAGITITAEDMQKLEVLIPQLPGMISQGATLVNESVKNFDERLRVLEAGQNQIIDLLMEEVKNDSTRNIA